MAALVMAGPKRGVAVPTGLFFRSDNTFLPYLFASETFGASQGAITPSHSGGAAIGDSTYAYVASNVNVDTAAVTKVSFANFTSGAGSNLQVAAFRGGAVKSSDYGLFTSENAGQRMQKYSFASQVTSQGGVLWTTNANIRRDFAAFYSGTKGYFVGGSINGNRTVSQDAYTFATDTNAPISATLRREKDNGVGWNSLVAGYNCFGSSNAPQNLIIEKLQFSNDTNQNIAALGDTTRNTPGAAGTQTYALIAGGSNVELGTCKFIYASDTRVAGTNIASAMPSPNMSASNAI